MRIMVIAASIVMSSGTTGAAVAPTKAAPRPPAPATAPTAVPIPRAAFIATMDAEFRKMDADGNNIVTKKEVQAYQTARVAAAVEARRKAVFAALDADHNGSITYAEFGKLQIPAQTPSADPVLAQSDLNRDGQVTLVEYRTSKLANFDRMDVDKDGTVTPAEMKAAGLIK